MNKNDEYEPKEKKKIIINGVNEEHITQYLFKEQYGRLVKQFKQSEPENVKVYEQLKFKDQIYARLESVMVYNLKYEVFAGLILKIINIKDGYGSYIPLFKIQWYYTKYDVNVPQPYNNYLSENELFLANHKEYLPIDRIIRKIQVLKLNSYEEMDQEQDYVYFSRAKLDIKRMTLIPPITKWHKECFCNYPYNPDLKYIYCEYCKKWQHLQCAKLTEEQAKKIDNYICSKCK